MARLVFIAPVRSSDQPSPAVSGMFQSLLSSANSHGVPMTFVVRYDALVDAAYATDLRSLEALGHETGAWLEITPGLCTAAGVTLNPNGTTTFAACRCTLLGYGQADRKKLIDTQFAAHLSLFGAYPTSIHAWFIDIYSALYCRDTYGVRLASLCRDQWGTDAYELQGGPQNTLWEASPTWLFAPCTPSRRSNLAVLRHIGVDLLHNYGDLPANDSGHVYSTEPAACVSDGVTIPGYWTPLVADQLAHAAKGGFGPVVSIFMENSYSWATYGPFADAALAQIASWSASGTTLQTASQVGSSFLASSLAVRDYPTMLRQTVDPYGNGTERSLDVSYPTYRARLRHRSDEATGYCYLSDLRVFTGAVDPYQSTVCNTQVGTWQVPWILDGSNYTSGPGGTSIRVAPDVPANLPLRAQWVGYDGSTFYDDAAGSIHMLAVAEEAGDGVRYNREGGTATLEFLPGGIVWAASRIASGAGSKLWLEYGFDAQDDPLSEFLFESSVEHSWAASSSVYTLTEYVGVSYVALAWANRDVAVILYPLSVVGGSVYGATSIGYEVRLGVQATGAGSIAATVAIVPTTKTYWRATLAALQANPHGYLRKGLTL